jgi:hypothetical protein
MDTRRRAAAERSHRLREALRVADDVATTWKRLRKAGAKRRAVPPPTWRRDIALMASEEMRRIVWVVETERRVGALWRIFERQLGERDATLAGSL